MLDRTTSGRLVLTEYMHVAMGRFTRKTRQFFASPFRGERETMPATESAWQFGADPSDVRNISRQNFIQNQGGGTWHDMERRWANELRTRPDVRLHVSVTDRHPVDKYGKERPMGRIVVVRRVRPNGKESCRERLHTSLTPTTPNVRDIQENRNTGRSSVEARRAGPRRRCPIDIRGARGVPEKNVVESE